MFMVRGLESEHKHLLVEVFRTRKLTLADTSITQVVEWVKDASDPLLVTIGGNGRPVRKKPASANHELAVPLGISGAQGGHSEHRQDVEESRIVDSVDNTGPSHGNPDESLLLRCVCRSVVSKHLRFKGQTIML